MKMTITSTFFTLALLCATTAHAASIETVAVGNAGNANDTHGDGYGGVAYNYRIGKTEVTNAQYVDFLNGVAATDTYGLYSASMGSTTLGGITRAGSSGNYSYAVKSAAGSYTYSNKPVLFVSFWDAARFANWMHNGMGNGDAEGGAYSNIGNESTITRNAGAKWFIPTENEWYKAAYYDPNHGGKNVGGYWDYATGTDAVPNNNLPSGDTGNSANFLQGGHTNGNSSYPLTDVGAYGDSVSAYGTHDQSGNVWELNETAVGRSRWLRGGGWNIETKYVSALFRSTLTTPSIENHVIGFRVATVPEPGSLALLVSGLGTLLLRRRRSFRRHALASGYLAQTLDRTGANAQTAKKFISPRRLFAVFWQQAATPRLESRRERPFFMWQCEHSHSHNHSSLKENME